MSQHTNSSPTPPDPVRALLHETCVATRWIEDVAAGAPYPDAEALYRASDNAVRALTGADVDEAISGHAVIGKPRADARSRTEQARVSAAGSTVKEQLAEANEAYREHFGQVFLICAAGRSPEEILAALRERMGNSPDAEREIVREELRKINRVRLGQTADEGLVQGMPETTTVSTHILDTSVGAPARDVPLQVATRVDAHTDFTLLATSATDPDGRCRDLPELPAGTGQVRLRYDTACYFTGRGIEVFFPEVTVTINVRPGQHYHVPLLLNPFGYSVYRGS